MKLLGVTDRTAKFIMGWVEIGDEYRRFVLHLDTGEADIDVRPPFKKSEFRNYLHFAGVIGKYDLSSVLTMSPVEIKEISEVEIDRALEGRPDLCEGLQVSQW